MGQRARVAVLAGLVASVHLAMGLAMRAPIIHPDELGYLSAARYLAGRGLAPQTEYFPGYSLLLVPAARVLSDPLSLWRAALVVNALLAGLTVVLTAALVRRLCPDLAEGRRLLLTGVVCLYPPMLLWSSLAIAESLLIPAFLGTVILAWRALETGRPRQWLAAGALATSLYATHPRGIVVALALGIVSLVALRPLRSNAGRLSALALGIAGVGVGGWLLAAWVARDAPATARAYDVSGTLTKNFTGAKLGGLAAEVGGQIWYLTVATFGLFPLGMAVAVMTLGRFLGGTRRDPEAAVQSFVALSVLGVLAIGSLFINNDVRIDYLVYGRYNEGVIAPVLVLGLRALVGLGLVRGARHLFRPLALVGSTVVASAAVLALGRGGTTTFHLPVVRTNIFGFDALLTWRNLAMPVVLFSVVGLVGAVAVMAVARFRPAAALGLAGLLFVPSVVTGHRFMVRGSHQRSQERAVSSALGTIDSRLGVTTPCVAYDRAGVSLWHEANYRLFLPSTRLQTFSSRSAGRPCSDLVVSGRRDFTAAYPGSREVMLENSGRQVLWVLPGRMQASLARAGLLLAADNNSALPDGARRYRLEPGGSGPLPVVLALRAGGRTEVPLSVTHTGHTAGWPNTFGLGAPGKAVRIGVRWYRLSEPGVPDDLATIDWARAELPRTLLPGESATLRAPLDARFPSGEPISAGTYRVQVEVVQDGVDWFDGGKPVVVEVVVVDRNF